MVRPLRREDGRAARPDPARHLGRCRQRRVPVRRPHLADGARPDRASGGADAGVARGAARAIRQAVQLLSRRQRLLLLPAARRILAVGLRRVLRHRRQRLLDADARRDPGFARRIGGGLQGPVQHARLRRPAVPAAAGRADHGLGRRAHAVAPARGRRGAPHLRRACVGVVSAVVDPRMAGDHQRPALDRPGDRAARAVDATPAAGDDDVPRAHRDRALALDRRRHGGLGRLRLSPRVRRRGDLGRREGARIRRRAVRVPAAAAV